MPNKPLTARPEFQALQRHHQALTTQTLKALAGGKDANRFARFSRRIPGFLADFSRQRVTGETLKLLFALARAAGVEQCRDAMAAGAVVNQSESRPALHMALRGSLGNDVQCDGEAVSAWSESAQKKFLTFVDRHIRSGIKHVVNIGIGGSDIGARALCAALGRESGHPQIHFVSSLDSRQRTALLKTIDPVSTLFLIVSKTFCTAETLANAQAIKDVLGAASVQSFYAVTENIDTARRFGIAEDNIFPLRSWIGGRYSLWSAVGMTAAFAAGTSAFRDFLDGAREMDRHFLETPLEDNIPVLLALLEIWNRNFEGYALRAVLPYAADFDPFVQHIQQLEMESLGKAVTTDGYPVDYATGAAVIGGAGTEVQHSFLQMLHQGTDVIPSEFILFGGADRQALNRNALSQAAVLMQGGAEPAAQHRTHPGNRPSTSLVLDRLDARHLGQLFALYEHKVFAQATIWNINPFDQWGVERGKALAAGTMTRGAAKASPDTIMASLEDHLADKPLKD